MALEVDVDSFRAKWWTVGVSILFIGIPSVMVLLFFTIPDQMFLDGSAIPNDYQSAVFHNLARSNACGDTLAIVVCFFMVTTREFSVFKVCNITLTVWMALENLMVLVELATYGQLTDAVGDTVDLINLFLMLYMAWKIRSQKAKATRKRRRCSKLTLSSQLFRPSQGELSFAFGHNDGQSEYDRMQTRTQLEKLALEILNSLLTQTTL